MNEKNVKTTETEPSSSIQRYSYQLTINNPVDHGFSHDKIKKTLVKDFTTLRYFCMADEMGTCYHTHIYAVFTSRVRLKKVKKSFPPAHIEIAHGTAKDNVEYIKKSGRWKDTEKAETQIPSTYEEWGDYPTQAGRNQDLELLYQMINDGLSTAEIIQYNNDYLPNIDLIAKARQMLIIEKNKGVRLDLRVIYVYGATGTGKTRGIVEMHGTDLYRVTDYSHPFDGYNYNQVICFDEFHSQLSLPCMLDYLDIYPTELPSRYSNKFACYTTVYIVSNLPLEEQYKDHQTNGDPNAYKAWLRRIHEVWHYSEDGTVTKYDSVETYLHRNESFHPADSNTEIPFENNEDKKNRGGKCDA